MGKKSTANKKKMKSTRTHTQKSARQTACAQMSETQRGRASARERERAKESESESGRESLAGWTRLITPERERSWLSGGWLHTDNAACLRAFEGIHRPPSAALCRSLYRRVGTPISRLSRGVKRKNSSRRSPV